MPPREDRIFIDLAKDVSRTDVARAYSELKVYCDKQIRNQRNQTVLAATPITSFTSYQQLTDAPMPTEGHLDDPMLLKTRKVMSGRQWGVTFSGSADRNANIRPTRIPYGKTCVAWAWGILWVISIGIYFQVGEKYRDKLPYLMDTQRPKGFKNNISIGRMTVPADVKGLKG